MKVKVNFSQRGKTMIMVGFREKREMWRDSSSKGIQRYLY
jgi:hypothetical protein